MHQTSAMATLIPAIGTCRPRMTEGERRLAERLESKLDDDYLLWYDVPVGPQQSHPDFVLLHPRRGLLILETKHWHIDTLQHATRQYWEILVDGHTKVVINPLAQARHCAIQVVNQLERDPQLIQPQGAHQGKLAFPWGHGAVFSRITRKQFDAAGLGEAIAPHLVICADEMTEAVDAEAFQQRLWDMFPHAFGGVMSLPQIDRVRWLMFPQVRIQSQTQTALFDDNDASAEVPDLMRVMDLQQEQLARSLGDGHRVVHGVAGSGKTMILGYRAEFLARAATAAKPVLVLCFNEPLAINLALQMQSKGLTEKVHVRHFHQWCRQQLITYGQGVPAQGPDFFNQLVNKVVHNVERKQIPSGQYQAVLVDEGHDFRPEWLKLVVQMVDPSSNCLLVLYDDAQSIYERHRAKKFSFKSVGIQAQGRTTVLKINYRNTRQILQTASLMAADLLGAKDQHDTKAKDDEIDVDDDPPKLTPIPCGRDGPAPSIVRLPSVKAEAEHIADHLFAAHQQGRTWAEMAVLCRSRSVMNECAMALARRSLPHQVRMRSGQFDPQADTIKVMTMHASKGLEFPVVALAGVGGMPQAGQSEAEEAKLFYVAATRATQTLCITLSGAGEFARRLAH
jgi:UvrD-like helicase C-terminal domain/Nuclease-related domain/AAA domain